MSLDTQAKYKVVRVGNDSNEIVKSLLNRIVIKSGETNDRVFLNPIENNDFYYVSKSQIQLQPYFDLRGQDRVNLVLQACSFDSIVAINGRQYSRLLEQNAKSRGITLEIHEDPKIDIKTTITTKDFLESIKLCKEVLPLDTDGFFIHNKKPIIKGDKEIVDDILDACEYVTVYRRGLPLEIPIKKPIFQKDLMKTLDDYKYYHFSLDDEKRLPDEVIFKDGKTTLLFSVNNDGKAPYNSYSSKVTKGDTFDKEFGFLITYLKYLKDNYKVVLQECFDFKGKARLSFLYGVVRQLCENNNIDVADLNNYAIHILNNDRYTLKQYNDWKRESETKAKRYVEVVNEIEAKEKELDKLKKQKENLK